MEGGCGGGGVAKWTFDGKKAGLTAYPYPDAVNAQLEEAWQRFSNRTARQRWR